MSLKNWLDSGWLQVHVPTQVEIVNLLAVADRDLAQGGAQILVPEWKLNICYSAARALADLALRAEGFRASRERAHELPIEGLRFTVGVPQGVVDDLKRFKRKRNIDTYERTGIVSDAEAEEMRVLAATLRVTVAAWLHQQHPQLL